MNPNEPKEIEVNPDSLKIVWEDGVESLLPARQIRAACSCAGCASEVTGERFIDLKKIPEKITITHAEPTGNYAVTLHFSDGHKTGIFTYGLLRSLTGC